jgi:hypothetical protein
MDGQASTIARLTQLAPDIIEDCLARADNGSALAHLMRRKLPGDWGHSRPNGTCAPEQMAKLRANIRAQQIRQRQPVSLIAEASGYLASCLINKTTIRPAFNPV